MCDMISYFYGSELDCPQHTVNPDTFNLFHFINSCFRLGVPALYCPLHFSTWCVYYYAPKHKFKWWKTTWLKMWIWWGHLCVNILVNILYKHKQFSCRWCLSVKKQQEYSTVDADLLMYSPLSLKIFYSIYEHRLLDLSPLHIHRFCLHFLGYWEMLWISGFVWANRFQAHF